MTRIIVDEDCGNSPINNLILQVTIAIAKRDTKSILSTVTDNIRWHIVGSQMIEGRENLAEFLTRSKNNTVTLLNIHHTASHGKAGAVDGTHQLKNGESLAFCNINDFANAKGTLISEITSYIINIK